MVGPLQDLDPLRGMESILWPPEEDIVTCELPKDRSEGNCIAPGARGSERWMGIRICVTRTLRISESSARSYGVKSQFVKG